MWLSENTVKVYLKPGFVDMRKSVDSLSIMVSEVLEGDPFSGHLFAFCNRSRKIIKVLYWDRNGFCIWYKRLEKGVFRWPEEASEVMELSPHQLRWLLDGLSINQPKSYPSLNYSCVY